MKKKLSIIGGGACALVLASEIDTKQFDVTLYERNANLGRKFLVAGDGGLNITHSESKAQFIKRYTPHEFLQSAFDSFSNEDLITWLNDLGIETFTGSSGRVFPDKGIKPAEVLAVFLKKIKINSVVVKTKHTWQGFGINNSLLVEHNNQLLEIKSDVIVYCLGGASWPVTGSKGDWLRYFADKNISVKEFQSSNCAFKIVWPEDLVSKIEGKVLKNISLSSGNKKHEGEIVLTKFGVEGSGIYPLSPEIRDQLNVTGAADITIDLKPSLTPDKIIEKLAGGGNKNLSDILKNVLNFTQTHIQLLKTFISKEDFLDHKKLTGHIKSFKLTITGMAPIEEAISTVGGVSLPEINKNFELKKLPGHYAIGEMLDYDAPTGGYLLQSCFTMGKCLAEHLNSSNI
ncbi:MAG: NAD(P)-dependent oxidoreductase [Bacteroidetes bacterium]|nr:NAD(P)-dependent oxidoreductase [Bacteroidota bacterium]